jgi:hypothetical protein
MNDDDEHERILNTPIMDGKILQEAVTALEQAQKGDDPDDAYDALAGLGALVRKMLENTADLYGMAHDRMCFAALVAAFDMAQDAKPDRQSMVAGYAKARLGLLTSHH